MMKRKHHNSSEKGFSLIEVCLAMVVMAIGLTAVFALFPSSLEIGAKSKHANKVALFAHELNDIIRYEVDKSGTFNVLTNVVSGIDTQLGIVHTDPLDANLYQYEIINVGVPSPNSADRVKEREYTLRIYHNFANKTGTFDDFYSIVSHD